MSRADGVGVVGVALVAAALESRHGWESAAFFVGSVLLLVYGAREVVAIVARVRRR